MSASPARIALRAALLLAAALLILPWIGPEPIGPRAIVDVWNREDSIDATILISHRAPRVLLAVLVGGMLAVSGAALQVLFRNPLAEPWTLGVSGGAAIGAFWAQAVPALHLSIGPLHSGQFAALLGAVAAMALVWVFARRRDASGTELLLAGVTIAILSGSIILLSTYFLAPLKFLTFHRWTLGGLDVVGFREALSALVLGAPGLVLLFAHARAYDHLAFGEDFAMGQGVDVARVRRRTFVGAGLAAAACVAVAGPIGFVGLIVPHAVRYFTGPSHRAVLPVAFTAGGLALAVCDTFARTVIAPTEIPVGIITAVLGGPAFLYMLARR
jgi:iron complex transport system permease protein